MTGPANSTTSEEGSRWYIHPVTQERFVSVTTALQAISKAALIPWAANLAAQAAMAELPRLVAATITAPCGKHATDDRCGNCHYCVQRWVAHRHYAESQRGRERGSAIHKVQEWWATHGDHIGSEPEYEPWVKAFRRFTDTYRPEVFLTETTVLNREHTYAGTLDLGIGIKAGTSRESEELCSRFNLDMVRLLVDTKTTRKTEARFFPEWALQLAGYRHAEKVMLPDGEEHPIPDVDGTAILLLRADGEFTLRPVVADEMSFAAFLCALNLYRWLVDMGDAATQVRSFPAPKKTAPPRKRALKAVPNKVDPSSPMTPLREVAKQQSATLRRTRQQSATSQADPFDLTQGGPTTFDDPPF